LMANPDSHGAYDSIVGFAHLRFGQDLAPQSFGGKPWVTFVRQDPAETYAPLNQLLIKVTTYGAAVFAILWVTGVVVAGRGGHCRRRGPSQGSRLSRVLVADGAAAGTYALRKKIDPLRGRYRQVSFFAPHFDDPPLSL